MPQDLVLNVGQSSLDEYLLSEGFKYYPNLESNMYIKGNDVYILSSNVDKGKQIYKLNYKGDIDLYLEPSNVLHKEILNKRGNISIDKNKFIKFDQLELLKQIRSFCKWQANSNIYSIKNVIPKRKVQLGNILFSLNNLNMNETFVFNDYESMMVISNKDINITVDYIYTTYGNVCEINQQIHSTGCYHPITLMSVVRNGFYSDPVDFARKHVIQLIIQYKNDPLKATLLAKLRKYIKETEQLELF